MEYEYHHVCPDIKILMRMVNVFIDDDQSIFEFSVGHILCEDIF